MKDLKMKIVKSILFSLSFLTIIPIKNIKFTEEEIKESIKFFPIAGLFIGILLYLISLIKLPIEIKSLIILFVWEFITGFFHLDGLADTSDAIFSSRQDKVILFKIMEDSRIGTMGVCMIFFILLGKYIFLIKLLKVLPYGIIVVPLVGRFSINFLSWLLDYAKDKGLGKFICENNSNRDIFISFLIVFFTCIIINFLIMLKFFCIIVILFILAKYFKKKFGGVTGDLFGFSVEVIETIFLFALILM